MQFSRAQAEVLLATLLAAATHGAVYDVGPGKPHDRIASVPWATLQPGDVVRIHHRPEPYKEKWLISAGGTEQQPVIVQGIAGGDDGKELPVIDGRDAVAPSKLPYSGAGQETRGIVQIGNDSQPASHVIVESLEIRTGRPGFQFTDSNSGARVEYRNNAAAVFVKQGHDVTIRGCVLRDCANGLFVSNLSKRVLVQGCHIYDNGQEENRQRHDCYTECEGIIFEHNRIGPLRPGCGGNALKDRSSGTVVRYNWIEGGSRQLDLVETESDTIAAADDYGRAWVYGNVIIKTRSSANSQFCQFGGDQDAFLAHWRKGPLYFYNNTVISKREDNSTLLKLSSPDGVCDVRNNIVHTYARPGALALLEQYGTMTIANNWLRRSWRNSREYPFRGKIADAGGNIAGFRPGVVAMSDDDFRLTAESACRGTGCSLPAELAAAHALRQQYSKHCAITERPAESALDIGAFGHMPE